ncbi:hypothetical protein H4R18_004240 [Coemansia javaensis]|uniref:DUF2423 domain-containing protein n=1 Tax=Coemansia javaensis TaxID=2761396 RepID=A0A9W8HC75_9FUNG|nr:hypothetical protein H4R18_004240 [Coemansia javaensis]
MARSIRSKAGIRNRNQLRETVFAAHEAARIKRLAERQRAAAEAPPAAVPMKAAAAEAMDEDGKEREASSDVEMAPAKKDRIMRVRRTATKRGKKGKGGNNKNNKWVKQKLTR